MSTAQSFFTDRPHALIVDDDDRIRDLLLRYLATQGWVVAGAADAAQADALLKSLSFDIAIVDIMMPGEDGLSFTRRLKASASRDLPVLLLTAKGELADRIEGFEGGADDYLIKPFDPKELELRLKAILKRRPRPVAVSAVFELGDITVDLDAGEITDGQGVRQKLTAVEVKLLQALSQAAGTILDRQQLAQLCGAEFGDRTIDVQVARLRRKIEQDSKIPRYLQTVRGQGYILRMGKA